jgi:1-acyl-sn-glycerol-3-phosphate acyltransferase
MDRVERRGDVGRLHLPGPIAPPAMGRETADRTPPKVMAIANFLRWYHDHRVVGLENIPATGSALLVHNHSFATYDVFLLGAAIYEGRGRMVRGLGHKLLFKIPVLNELMTDAGMVNSSMETARLELAREHVVGLAPGGMREAIRPTTEKYKVRWGKRKGFVRLAMSAQCPVILAACPRADDIYTVSTGWMTELAYDRFKIPLAFVRGAGGTLLPRRVRLTHHLSAPIQPPDVPESSARFEAEVDAWHQYLIERIDRLMADALL